MNDFAYRALRFFQGGSDREASRQISAPARGAPLVQHHLLSQLVSHKVPLSRPAPRRARGDERACDFDLRTLGALLARHELTAATRLSPACRAVNLFTPSR